MLDKILDIGISMSRYLTAALVLVIIGGCLYSLLGRRYSHKCTAFLVPPEGGKERLGLQRWENSVGRAPSCDITVPVGTVSRFHAVVAKHGKSWTVVDTYSKTGTFVNNVKIDKRTVLGDGDTVAFGTAVFKFVLDDEERERTYIPALIDEAEEKAFCLQCGQAVIGRGDDCDIQLPYSAVSRTHARVFCENDEWYIEDLNSSVGTTVNAKKISTKRRLTDGCVIGIGGIILVFEAKYKEV